VSGYHVAFAVAAVMLAAGAVILAVAVRRRDLESIDLELAPSGLRQRVVLGLAPVLRLTPLGAQPPFLLQPVQRRKQRSRLHVERAARHLADAPRYPQLVQRFEPERRQDEQVERALQQIAPIVAHACSYRMTIGSVRIDL